MSVPASTALSTASAHKKAKFLQALGKSANVSRAAQWVGVDRKTPYNWRQQDPDFADAWDACRETGVDELEERAMELALLGESPALTIFMLKSLRPAVYSERQRIELTGVEGGPVAIAAVPVTPDDLAAAARALIKVAAE